MSCIFCEIVAKRIESNIIYEDESTLAFLDIFPASKGHILVIPKKHNENIFDIPEKDFLEINSTVHKITTFLKSKGVTALNVLHSAGEEAQQEVPHFHIHIIPRKKDDKINFGHKVDEKAKNELKKTAKELLFKRS